MSSKIEMCKTCNGTGIEYDGAGHTCTACNGIATPVVDRQPPECKCSAGMAVVPWLHAKHRPVSCYTAPPELAELQATIAQQAAEIERLTKIAYAAHGAFRMETLAERDLLKAEIERLKGGQGEPTIEHVASLVQGKIVSVDVSTDDHDAGNRLFCEIVEVMPDGDSYILLAVDPEPNFEQPAPVSAVNLRNFANSMIDIALEGGNADGAQIQELAVEHGLLKPEQRTERCGDTCSCAEYADFPVECFRKVKELNQ